MRREPLCAFLRVRKGLTVFETMGIYELVEIRTKLLRGIVETRYTTAEERAGWRLQVDAITAELNRRRESKP
jgi:hypothetical protein